ncbi:MAG: nucleotidyltransferase family protein [Rubrivivax sp.]|nr:nucleotidyltransferase family protein [Rubrivivax sp.]MDH5338612.1 nucleotidyltransferase family protein [Rubrivivax sp.]
MPATALILAAGRGERLRPHTDHTPKPLLPVRGKRLIEWHLEALAQAGVQELVINTAWLESQFPEILGDGSRWGLRIRYSMEQRDHGGALETAGGIAKALPWLDEVFWVVSGDVFVPGFDFRTTLPGDCQALMWMVPNPVHHAAGDFSIDAQGRLRGADHGTPVTWASVGLFRKSMFEDIAPGTRLPLRPVLEREIAAGQLCGTLWHGDWTDVGTPERWRALDR